MEEENYLIPNDLSECFTAIAHIISTSDKNQIQNIKDASEKEIIEYSNNNLETHIRKSWNLWDKQSTLHKHLSNMGLWHAEDMSKLIITSYHRYVNEKDLELKKQIQNFNDYWIFYEKNNGPIEKNKWI